MQCTARLTILIVIQHQIQTVCILVTRERLIHVYRIDTARAPVLPPYIIVVRHTVGCRMPVQLVAGSVVLIDRVTACITRIFALQVGLDVAMAAETARRVAVLYAESWCWWPGHWWHFRPGDLV